MIGDKAYVYYRLPNSNDFFSLSGKLDNNEIDKNGFVIHSFDSRKNYIVIPDEELKNQLHTFDYNIRGTDSIEYGYDKYQSVFKIFHEALTSNEYQKIVLSRPIFIPNKNIDIQSLFKNLMDSYPQVFVYCFYSESIGLWVGATPEILMDLNDGKLKTTALAGTKKVDESNSIPLWTDKEIEEQKIVQDYISDILSSHDIPYSKTETYNFFTGILYHLKTDFLFQTSEIDKLVNDLHPTPAVAGIPKHNAIEFILKNENYSRDFYTGYIGFKDWRGNTKLFVNLRCMQIFKDRVCIYVGGGLTKDSECKSEWDETENKSKTLIQFLKH